MIIIVLPNLNFSKKFIISSSFFLSNELVGSSKIINSGSLYNALANPNLCFSPIDKLVPPSDISYDGSNFSNLVFRKQSTTFSVFILLSSYSKEILFLILSLNKKTDCGT